MLMSAADRPILHGRGLLVSNIAQLTLSHLNDAPNLVSAELIQRIACMRLTCIAHLYSINLGGRAGRLSHCHDCELCVTRIEPLF